MPTGVRLGRLFGINISIDWSWLFIFVLVTWNLAMVFAASHPGWGPGLTWDITVVASPLFFASVLAHELAQSLVANAYGIPVRSITLFLFGAVASIQQEPSSPRAEFLITIAGPVTSLMLGVFALVLGSLTAGG